MVNFHDPAIQATDGFALLKYWHVVDGVFIWEFLTTLDFEWSIIQGRRRYRWTIWIYSLSRVAALAAVVANLVLLDLKTQLDCRLYDTLALVPSYLALSAASLLLVFRIFAIWQRNMVAVVTAFIIWAANGAFFIQSISQLRYEKVSNGFCVTVNIQATKMTVIVAFVTDILLLGIMLVGLFRLGFHRHGALVTGRFLWNQGVIWLLLATAAGLLPVVFACLNLNESLNVIFRIPWILTMSIAATRMYRGLDEFLSSDIISSSHLPPLNDGCTTISMSIAWGTAVPTPPDGIKVDMHTSHDHSLASPATQYGLDSNMDK